MDKKDFKEWAVERSKKKQVYEKVKKDVEEKYVKGAEEFTEKIIIRDTEIQIYKKTLEEVETRISYIFDDNLSLEVAYVFENSCPKLQKRARARWKSLFVDDSLGIEYNEDKRKQLQAKAKRNRKRLLKEAQKRYIEFLKTEKAQKKTKEQRRSKAIRLAAKAYVEADQDFWEHPMGQIKTFVNISKAEQKLFELLLKHLSCPSLFSHLKKDRWEVINKEKRERIFEAVRSVYDTDEWKRDFVSRYKELADLERIKEKLLHPERFRLGDCLKHIYASVDYVESCGTEDVYKHIQGQIESLECLVVELEDIYVKEYYAAFRKKLERLLEVGSENGTLSVTEKEGMAIDEIRLDTMQDFFDKENRQKQICDMEKTLKAWEALTGEQRGQLCIILSEKYSDVAPPLKDAVQGEANQELPNMFFVNPRIILFKDRIKKIYSSVAHMEFEVFSDNSKKPRKSLEKKALELYEYIKMIEDKEKWKEEIENKEADRSEEEAEMKEYEKWLRETYGHGSCNA